MSEEPATLTPETETESATDARALRKTRVGIVVSDKMDKTIAVEITTRVPHPKFGKIIKRMTKFHAHDEKNEAKIGDRVIIAETRPLSRLKRWRLIEITQH